MAASGHAAHPEDIVASCRALQAHVAALQADADAALHSLEERIRARELAEKRRVAPGWLDSDARLLEPERRDRPGDAAEAGPGMQASLALTMPAVVSEMAAPDQGEELDRVFGSMALGR